MSELESGKMIDHKKGIMAAISSILGVIGIEVDRQGRLERKLREVAQREEMVFQREMAPYWGALVYDSNRIHLFESFAREMGFEDTPVYGTWIAARAEQYVSGLIEAINSMAGKKLCYEGHSVAFKRPLYPGKKAEWTLGRVAKAEAEKSGEGIDLSIFASDSDGNTVVDCRKVSLRLKRQEPNSEEITPFLSGNNLAIRKKFSLSPGELEQEYKCLGKTPEGKIPMMIPAAFFVAALLDISARKSGMPKGGYSGLDLKFYDQPEFGCFEMLLRLGREPRESDGMFHYNFGALCIQNDKPIIGGNIRCYSPEKFEV